ncbi:hypothetical protein QJS10_CPB19g01945 [Acorus calamus]|uniref:Nuclear pore complex protein n=1 Tax=Acorus calamus TaxID=4465 RepID=A0AAV9CI84_ACOCL|nr:hypothetical protein QJS10_CPB19g01945 [Acorus calamus]
MENAMDVFDPENDSNREQFRRFSFRKRQSASSVSPIEGNSASRFTDARLLYDDDNMQPRPNVALLLEDIKQEVENFDNEGLDVVGKAGSHLLKSCKREDDVLAEGGESTFILFASLLDSAIQGLMPFSDLILQFENTCRNVSESIRFGNSGRHRVFEDKLMRQRAQLLLDEAASWSLLWYLFGKGNEVHPEDLILLPTTSHQDACQYVMGDHTAQLCLRIVQWLEGLASEALDLEEKVRGSHVGSYLPSSGVWHHTQRFLKKRNDDPAIVQHLDFDAPTREVAQLLPDDKKQDESLLEDVWILLRAGRSEEACELCRSAGQSWRAATLTSFGGLDLFPSIEALQKNGKSRTLQALELESGIGRQRRLWKWTSYYTSEKIADQDGGKYEAAVYASRCGNLKRMLPVCTDWESACWAMAKSWFDTQVDLYLGQVQQDEPDPSKSSCDSVMNGSSRQEGQSLQVPLGPESWPCHVLDQQPLDLPALLQKLHSSDIVHEVVCRGCKDHHRQIEMNLMSGDIAQLLDLLWSWMSPLEDDKDVLRPHIDPQMIRFGAHLVLVLRHLLAGEVDTFREKLMTVGDFILQMYTMFLFSKNHEELIGIYASQLAPHRCIDLFVNMMELRMNDSVQVKYKIFLSAIEYLPFSTGDGSKGCFENIIERVLQRSRDIKIGNCDKTFYVSEQKHFTESSKSHSYSVALLHTAIYYQ